MPQTPEETLDEEEALVFIMLVIMGAAVALIWMAMSYRRRVREMEHRERLAMIDRGLVPPPELDPAGFESRVGLPRPAELPGALRSRSAGVMLIGLGLALAVLITFVAGAPDIGIGVGGAFAVLGGAFLFNGTLLARQPPPPPLPRTATARRADESGIHPPNVGP